MSQLEKSLYQQSVREKQLEMNKAAAQKLLQGIRLSLTSSRVSSVQVGVINVRVS